MLEDLRRAGQEVRLPKDALITPAARDWLKACTTPVTWEESAKGGSATLAVVMDASLPEMRAMRAVLDRSGGLMEVIEPVGGRSGIAAATRRLCGKVFRKEVAKGIVFAQDGCVPLCVANKHNGIRAALGTNIPHVEEACRQLGVNVLVIEYPGLSTYQIRQMIERVMKGSTAPQPELGANIAAIEAGGGRADW
jgi:ribose 5-phosphate isomerase RpiB